jgi:hypothetical protein
MPESFREVSRVPLIATRHPDLIREPSHRSKSVAHGDRANCDRHASGENAWPVKSGRYDTVRTPTVKFFPDAELKD